MPKCHRCGNFCASYTCGPCLDTDIEDAPENIRPAKAKAYRRHYNATCEIHGYTKHAWDMGCCLKCYTRRGLARAKSPRAAARADGQTEFNATCETHGENTPHSVAHGKCLRCFTMAGAKRKRPETLTVTFSSPEERFRYYRARSRLGLDETALLLGVTPGVVMCYEGPDGPEAPEWAYELLQALTPGPT